MKLLFITSSYPYGQGEGFVDAELQAFLDEGCDVDVLPVYPRGKSNFDNRLPITLQLKLFKVIYLYDLMAMFLIKPMSLMGLFRLGISNSLAGSFRNFLIIPKVCHLYRKSKNDYDFVYAYWASMPAQFAMFYAYLCRIKWAFCAHRWDIVEANNFKKKLKRCSFARFISESGVKLLDQKLLQNVIDKIHIIHVGVSTDNINISVNILNIENKIICIANLLPVKGIEYLIMALTQVANKSLSLDIVGDGPERNSLERLSRECGLNSRINFLGYIPHDEVLLRLMNYKYLCLVLPSVDLGGGLHEGIPVVLMEAMARGVPVISTNSGGIPELIGSESEYGICVKPASPDSIARAIDSLADNSNLRHNIIIKGHDRVRCEFDCFNNSIKILSIIKTHIL